MLGDNNSTRLTDRRTWLLGAASGVATALFPQQLLASAPVAPGAWYQLDLARIGYLSFPTLINTAPVTAIVDSGATRSAIRDELALQYGLPYIGSTLGRALTQDIAGSLYRIDALDVAGVSFRHVDVAGFDMQAIDSLAGHAPLILGQDILRQVAIQVEFVANRARIVAPSQGRHSIGFQRLAIAESDRTIPSLPIALEHRVHENAMIDLGNSLPLTISRDYAVSRGMLTNRQVSTTMTVGLEGPTISQILTISEVRLGPYQLRNVPTCVVEHWRLEQPISLGWPLFAAFDAIYSFGGGAIWLKTDEQRLARPFPKDRSGIGGMRFPDQIVVRHVAYRSPAWAAGVREGDSIVAIDGRDVDASYPEPGTRFGVKPAGTRLQLRLADNREATLVLADYY